jgi:hypothetical protein
MVQSLAGGKKQSVGMQQEKMGRTNHDEPVPPATVVPPVLGIKIVGAAIRFLAPGE